MKKAPCTTAGKQECIGLDHNRQGVGSVIIAAHSRKINNKIRSELQWHLIFMPL